MEKVVNRDILVPAPPNDNRFSNYVLIGHESPETGIVRIVAIVPHHEHMVLWHGERRNIITGTEMRREDVWVNEFQMRGHLLFDTIDKNLLVDYFDPLATDCDTSLDEVLRGICRIFEYNDFAGFRITESDYELVSERNAKSVNELNRHKLVAHQKGVFHGAGWDFKRRNYKRANDRSDQKRYNYGFDPFLAEFIESREVF